MNQRLANAVITAFALLSLAAAWVVWAEYRGVVAALSAIGLGTTVAEATGAGTAVDAGVSVVKTTVKYVTKIFKKIPDSMLKTAITGQKLGAKAYKRIWALFKSIRPVS